MTGAPICRGRWLAPGAAPCSAVLPRPQRGHVVHTDVDDTSVVVSWTRGETSVLPRLIPSLPSRRRRAAAGAGSAADAALSSLHTENQGWLWFRHPKDLAFKATAGNIDLYVAVNGFAGTGEELQLRLTALSLPEGFSVATDTARNVVIRHACPRFATAAGVPDTAHQLHEALDACARITEWFDAGGAGLLVAEQPPSLSAGNR